MDSERKPARSFEPRRHLDGVFEEGRALKRAPAQLGGRGNQSECGHGALQECLLGAERSLPVLVLREQVVGLHALQPDAGFDLIAPARPVDVIVPGEQIARRAVVAARVGARAGDRRCAVRGRAAADDDGAHRIARHPARNAAHRHEAGEEVAGARVTKARRVQQRRRKHVLLLDAGHLLAQALVDQLSGLAEGVLAELASTV